jgi:CheY-like chemotaxis protein
VVAVETGDPDLPGTAALALALPCWTRFIHAVPAGSPSLRDPASIAGCTVRVLPFSPNDLREFTEQLDEVGIASGTTMPAPLTLDETPRILIVDDSPVNLVVGRGLVESLGYAADTAEDGLQAITRCRSCAPDAVLMDIDMPVLNGIDASIRLRGFQSRGELPPFPIVALTASWSPALQRECLAAGMDDCLPKPISVEQLARCIRRVVTLR